MEENKRFRNHISIIVEQTGGILIALLIILVPQLLENIRDITDITEAGMQLLSGKGMLVNLGILLVLFVIVGWQVLVWARTYISIQENAIVIDRETLNRKKDTIGIRNISNINMEQNLFEMLIGTCKLKLDTNSRSTADSTDVKIVLKKEAALRFKQEIEGHLRKGKLCFMGSFTTMAQSRLHQRKQRDTSEKCRQRECRQGKYWPGKCRKRSSIFVLILAKFYSTDFFPSTLYHW